MYNISFKNNSNYKIKKLKIKNIYIFIYLINNPLAQKQAGLCAPAGPIGNPRGIIPFTIYYIYTIIYLPVRSPANGNCIPAGNYFLYKKYTIYLKHPFMNNIQNNN